MADAIVQRSSAVVTQAVNSQNDRRRSQNEADNRYEPVNGITIGSQGAGIRRVRDHSLWLLRERGILSYRPVAGRISDNTNGIVTIPRNGWTVLCQCLTFVRSFSTRWGRSSFLSRRPQKFTRMWAGDTAAVFNRLKSVSALRLRFAARKHSMIS